MTSEATQRSPAADPARESSDDSSRLIVLVVVITLAALVVVAALWAAAAIDTPWALAAVMAVHLTTTASVFVVVAYVIFGRAVLPHPHGHRGGPRDS
jgi:hypothetical protein